MPPPGATRRGWGDTDSRFSRLDRRGEERGDDRGDRGDRGGDAKRLGYPRRVAPIYIVYMHGTIAPRPQAKISAVLSL